MTINVIAISGSLRKASTNTGLLREAIKNSPSNMKITYYPILDFPLYNDDLIINGIKPEPIQKAYEEFSKADGFLFGAPCYNHSVSSPLKNVIDWLSRNKSPLKNKPLGYFHSGNNPNNYI
jgi:chromate reductase